MNFKWRFYSDQNKYIAYHGTYVLTADPSGSYEVFHNGLKIGFGEKNINEFGAAEQIANEHATKMLSSSVDQINAMRASDGLPPIGVNADAKIRESDLPTSYEIPSRGRATTITFPDVFLVPDLARRVCLDPSTATRKQVEDRIDALMREPAELVKKERELRQESENRLIEERLMKERIIGKISGLEIRCRNQSIQIGEMAEEIRQLRKSRR
jgi:hypothetical protein